MQNYNKLILNTKYQTVNFLLEASYFELRMLITPLNFSHVAWTIYRLFLNLYLYNLSYFTASLDV